MRKFALLLLSALLTFSLRPVCMAAEDLFKQADVNKDTVISMDEFLEFWRAADFNPKRDVNNDGLLSTDEWADEVSFKNFDLNNDGVIADEEANEKRKGHFVFADKNEDGSLDIAEFLAK